MKHVIRMRAVFRPISKECYRHQIEMLAERMDVSTSVLVAVLLTYAHCHQEENCEPYGEVLTFINNRGKDWFSIATNNIFNLQDCLSITSKFGYNRAYCFTLAKEKNEERGLCGPCPYEIDQVQLPPKFEPPILLSVRCRTDREERKPWFWLCRPQIKAVEVFIAKPYKKYKLNISKGCVCYPSVMNETEGPRVVD